MPNFLLSELNMLCNHPDFLAGNFHWTPEDVAKSIVCMLMSGPCLTGYTQVLYILSRCVKLPNLHWNSNRAFNVSQPVDNK